MHMIFALLPIDNPPEEIVGAVDQDKKSGIRWHTLLRRRVSSNKLRRGQLGKEQASRAAKETRC